MNVKSKLNRLNDIAGTFYALAFASSFISVMEPLIYGEPASMTGVWLFTTILIFWSGTKFAQERERLASEAGIETNRNAPLWGQCVVIIGTCVFILVGHPIIHIAGVLVFMAGFCFARYLLFQVFRSQKLEQYEP